MLYKNGVVIGGFQPLHIGHEHIINTALNLCDNVYIFIGQRKNVGENGFDFNTRKYLIEKVFKTNLNRIHILQNEYKPKEEWGQYILQLLKDTLGSLPNIIIHGDEDFRRLWFNQKDRTFNELFLPRSEPYANFNLSGTNIRKALLVNDFKYYKKCVNPILYEDFNLLKNKLNT